MSKIESTIVKHSKCPRGHELITCTLVFPRFLLAELNTHRMFSKNSASSRAIPYKKMASMVKNNCFIPMQWQKNHSGMQGNEYMSKTENFSLIDFVSIASSTLSAMAPESEEYSKFKTDLDEKLELIEELLKPYLHMSKTLDNWWLLARDKALEASSILYVLGVTKQLCNRLLEPFMWHKVVLTTGLEGLRNFFELRCPEYQLDKDAPTFKSWKEVVKNSSNAIEAVGLNSLSVIERLKLNKGQAEIHMMELAEQMYDAYNESVPQLLNEGEWHIPYDDIIDAQLKEDGKGVYFGNHHTTLIKASTGMLARASYITIGDDKVPSMETLIGIHDKMVNARPKHSSPMEHCSQVMTEEEYYLFSKGMDGQKDHEHGWCYNYRGFKNYRYILDMTSQA